MSSFNMRTRLVHHLFHKMRCCNLEPSKTYSLTGKAHLTRLPPVVPVSHQLRWRAIFLMVLPLSTSCVLVLLRYFRLCCWCFPAIYHTTASACYQIGQNLGWVLCWELEREREDVLSLLSLLAGNWQTFLRIDDNKTELFSFLAQRAVDTTNTNKQVITTHHTNMLTINGEIIFGLAPCTHEEADTCIDHTSSKKCVNEVHKQEVPCTQWYALHNMTTLFKIQTTGYAWQHVCC